MSTPHQIAMLLHHYASMGPWPLGKTSAYTQDWEALEEAGIFEFDDQGRTRVTEKGLAWVAAILQTPYPRKVWIDQNDKHLTVPA